MRVLVDFLGPWGLGDLLCADPMLRGLVERHGPDTRIWLRGRTGNLLHNPHTAGLAEPDGRYDRIVEVRLFTHLPTDEYARLEAMPSLIDHMCSYAGVAPRDRRPRLWLGPDDLAVLQRLPATTKPRIAICADHVDARRHWPVDRWQQVARVLHAAGAEVIGIGQHDRLGVGTDLVGRLSMRETAAVLSRCSLFVGNNSGPFHYAQAAGVPCVTLFSLAVPSRFVHPGAVVHAVEANGVDCLYCTTRDFARMAEAWCTASPVGRCMTEISIQQVLDTIDRALRGTAGAAAVTAAPASSLC